MSETGLTLEDKRRTPDNRTEVVVDAEHYLLESVYEFVIRNAREALDGNTEFYSPAALEHPAVRRFLSAVAELRDLHKAYAEAVEITEAERATDAHDKRMSHEAERELAYVEAHQDPKYIVRRLELYERELANLQKMSASVGSIETRKRTVTAAIRQLKHKRARLSSDA